MTDQRDFFISFTSADLEIATALNDALLAAGYKTYFHPLDKPKFTGIAEWMTQSVEQSAQMIAVCSEAYFNDEKIYSRSEWQAKYWADPLNKIPLLILARIDEFPPPQLLAQYEYCDLRGKTADQAAAHLVAELASEAQRKARVEAAGVQAHPPVFRVGGDNRYFAGRTEELTRLHEILTKGEGGAAITAVDGMGGVGKTTLAREYAIRFGKKGRFAGIWWLEAETEETIISGLERLARRTEVGVEPGQNTRETAEDVVEWLGAQDPARPWLIVYDNVPNAAAVRQWLPQGSARAIITSRNKYFEDVATPMSLDVWEEDTTARFILDRAKPAQGGEAEARSLARAIGNLPLAAEHAAAFLQQNEGVAFTTYEARLLELIQDKPEAMAGDYPTEIYASIVASLDAVLGRKEGEAALAILNICAFLAPEGVEVRLLTAAAEAEGVLPDPPRAALWDEIAREAALSSLRDYSLVKQGEDPEWGPVLTLHRLLRAVAQDRLSEAERETWTGAAVRMVDGAFPGNVSATPSNWPLAARLTPHALALEPLTLSDIETAKKQDRLLNQAALYLNARGDRGGAIRLLRRSVEIMQTTQKDQPLVLATALCNLAGRLEEDEETWGEAEALYREALEIEERELAPDDPSLATTLSNFGGLYRRRKEFEEAVKLVERAAEIFKAAHGEASSEYASGLSNLGAIYFDWANESGDPALREKEKAFTLKSLDVTLAARGARHPETAGGYNNLAVMHSILGDMALAAEMMARAVAIDLSLDLMQAPQTQQCMAQLDHIWTESGQADKAARLRGGDGADIVPVVHQIEEEHRQWVAEDPETRHFGPPSPITGARAGGTGPQEDQQQIEITADMLRAAGIDPEDLQRRMAAGEIGEEEMQAILARVVETLQKGD